MIAMNSLCPTARLRSRMQNDSVQVTILLRLVFENDYTTHHTCRFPVDNSEGCLDLILGRDTKSQWYRNVPSGENNTSSHFPKNQNH